MKKYLVSDLIKIFKRTQPAVQSWINQGLFPNAVLNESGPVPFWEIPETDVENFVPPARGRKKKILQGELPA